MAIWDFRPKADIWTGVAVGVGLLVAPVVLPMAWSGIRSLLKGVVKGSIMVYEKGHELLAEALEGTADLVEEARSEVRSELSAARNEGFSVPSGLPPLAEKRGTRNWKNPKTKKLPQA